MSGKYALIIGNSEYSDPQLPQLTAPSKDAEDFARILKAHDIGAFDSVNVLMNETSSSAIETIDEFFDQKKPDDLLVLYFSGHGLRDELGSLYLAFKNTVRSRLRATAIKSNYIREAMDQSRSKRQVLILDCCNSGAFPQGTKGEVGGPMGLISAFQGYGRYILTASDEVQFAWEGNKIIGETENSLFTHFILKGLEGAADSDSDGRITVDELYDYVYEQISKLTARQTPTKDASKQEGEIVLRQFTRIEDIKPVPLPSELLEEIEDTRPYVRVEAVKKLEKILNGRNIGLARSAKDSLEKIARDKHTTRYVAELSTQILKTFRKAMQNTEGLLQEKTEPKPDSKEEITKSTLMNNLDQDHPEGSKSETEPFSQEKEVVDNAGHSSGKNSKTDNKKSYKNQANSDHPATLIYLVDISGSMNTTMKDGKTRIEVAKNAIQIAYAQMIQRSMRQGKIHPRYRVGMIAYSDEPYDVYGNLGSIISIEKIKDEGVPLITPQKSTNMAKAFRYATKLIKDDIQSWSQKWLDECPPPMVINITDCEYNEKEAQDPLEFALSLQKISVPDGNVLIENIFITDQISVPHSAQEWQGYHFGDVTGDLYGDKLLAMSSPIPSTYAQILREQAGLKIREGTAMMFPGVNREFIKFGFVMSIVTGSQIMQTSRSGPSLRRSPNFSYYCKSTHINTRTCPIGPEVEGNQIMTIIESEQSREIGLTGITRGPFVLKFSSYRKREDAEMNLRSEDYIVSELTPDKAIFALCDGVGSSFYGDLGSQILGEIMLGWLRGISLPESLLLGKNDGSNKSLGALTNDLQSELNNKINLATSIVHKKVITSKNDLTRLAEITQRDDFGTQSNFASGILWPKSASLPNGLVLLFWLGNARLRIFNGNQDLTHVLGWGDNPNQLTEVWSSKEGVVGHIYSYLTDFSKITTVIAYSDGLENVENKIHPGLNEIQFETVVNQAQSIKDDDVSFLELTISQGEIAGITDDIVGILRNPAQTSTQPEMESLKLKQFPSTSQKTHNAQSSEPRKVKITLIAFSVLLLSMLCFLVGTLLGLFLASNPILIPLATPSTTLTPSLTPSASPTPTITQTATLAMTPSNTTTSTSTLVLTESSTPTFTSTPTDTETSTSTITTDTPKP